MSAAVLCVVVAAGWLVVCCFCVVLFVRVSVESSQGLNFLAFTPTNKRAATKNTFDKRLGGSDSARVNRCLFTDHTKSRHLRSPFHAQSCDVTL